MARYPFLYSSRLCPTDRQTHRPRYLDSNRPHLMFCIAMRLGLPDLPYFGDAVFQPRSPVSRKEAARETESPVFDYRLIQTGRICKLCDSNLHHAAWCDEHKLFYAANTLLRSAYFCRNSALFGPRCLII